MASDEVWILGATGRSGRGVARRLAEAGMTPVLVGRDPERLKAIDTGGRTVVVPTVDAMADEVRRQQPGVVLNTVGPFTATAGVLADAGLPGSHYLDLANDVVSASQLLERHDAAVAAGRTLVTGAGFGVVATQSVVAMLVRDRATPVRVRVDGVPSVAAEEGPIGDAVAATLVDGLPAGGLRFAGGRLARDRVGGDRRSLTLPDGTTVTTASVPLGELVAAWRVSGAPDVVAASSGVPSGIAARGILPVAGTLLAARPLRDLVRRRVARAAMPARPRPREHSYAHAEVEWANGTRREGWLRMGDASDFTTAVAIETILRLLRGEAPPGAYTPAEAFGPELAVAAGGEFLLD